ncbi:hypothetical protein U3516DRAFT_809811 [Neocallimastix sp. 'constans']
MTETIYLEENDDINKYTLKLNYIDDEDSCSYIDSDISDNSLISYNNNKVIKNNTNKFIQIKKEKDTNSNSSNRNTKEDEILDNNVDPYITEDKNLTSQKKNRTRKRSNQYFYANDFKKEHNKNSSDNKQDKINYNEKNYKLLMENVDFKDKAIKFEKFMNDIDNLIDNSNNLISIPSLVEIFKKNLYDIESVRSLLHRIKNQSARGKYDENILLYNGEKIISFKKYNLVLNELINMKKELKEKDMKIRKYEEKIENDKKLLTQLNEKNNKLENNVKNYEAIQKILDEKNDKLTEKVANNNNDINEKNNKIKQLTNELSKINEEYKNYKNSNEISSKNQNNYIKKLKETTSLNDKSYKYFKSACSQGNIFYYIESLKENIIKLEKENSIQKKDLELLKNSINDASANYKLEQQKLINKNKKNAQIFSLNTHKDTINQNLRKKIKIYENQIGKLKNEEKECKQLKQDIKFLKNNMTKKDEMIITNKNQIKDLTENYKDCREQLKNYKEINEFNNNKGQILKQRINTITKEKNNLQIKNEKLYIVLKKITEYLLSKYKDMLLKKEINISINSSNSAAKKKKMNKENENSINKKEIVEKIKTISENMLNIDLKDILNSPSFKKNTNHKEQRKVKYDINQEFLNQYDQTKNKLNKIINNVDFELDLYNYFVNLIELSNQ